MKTSDKKEINNQNYIKGNIFENIVSWAKVFFYLTVLFLIFTGATLWYLK